MSDLRKLECTKTTKFLVLTLMIIVLILRYDLTTNRRVFSVANDLLGFNEFRRRRVGANKELCSVEKLRKYFQEDDTENFPASGVWQEDGCADKKVPKGSNIAQLENQSQSSLQDKCHRMNKTVDMTFYPSLCRFAHNKELPPSFLQKCPSNIRKIVVMGDSNGRRYYDSLIKVISASPFVTCEVIKVEHRGKQAYLMDMSYFHVQGINDSQIVTERRNCHTCGSIQTNCTFSFNGMIRHFLFEHIPLLHYKENSFRLKEFIQSVTDREILFPEFIFHYYFAHNYPDVVILEPPFTHEKYTGSLSEVYKSMKYFAALLEKFLPKETAVVVLTSAYEQELLKSLTTWPYRYGKYGGFLANEMIEHLNQKLYEIFKPKFVNKTLKYFGFFDLGRMSEKVNHIWCSDSMHMFYVWYEKVMLQVMQLLCF